MKGGGQVEAAFSRPVGGDGWPRSQTPTVPPVIKRKERKREENQAEVPHAAMHGLAVFSRLRAACRPTLTGDALSQAAGLGEQG